MAGKMGRGGVVLEIDQGKEVEKGWFGEKRKFSDD